VQVVRVGVWPAGDEDEQAFDLRDGERDQAGVRWWVVIRADALRAVLAVENAKYGTGYGIELLDPAVNACFRVRPRVVFALREAEFTTSPTRWTFDR
jgi:hypothetical protein